ncbi:MAG: dehydrogenase [Phycisphaerae bacterium]
MEPLKLGLIGLGRCGRLVAEALSESSWCRLVAVGSQKAHRLADFSARHPGVATYDDYRRLIVNSGLDALCLAVPPFVRSHYLPLAAERRLPVWMLTPAARRLAEALETAELFEAAGVPLVVSRAFGIDPAMQEDAIGADAIGRVFLARGHVLTCLDDDLDWRGDSGSAGGGVLLDQAYPMIDTLVQVMGMPGSVYTAAGGSSRPGTRFPYDTEDTAAVILRYAGGGIGQIAASWTIGPDEETLHLHGLKASVRIDRGVVRVRDRRTGDPRAELPRGANPFAPQLEEFLTTLRTSPRKMRSTLREHLPVMAVMQAVYLSARTGQPESPGPILEMHQK